MPIMFNSELMSMYRTAVAAVKPNNLIRNAIRIDSNAVLNIWEKRLDLKHQINLANRDVFIFGAGKAVLGMCEEFVKQVEQHNLSCINQNQLSKPINIVNGRLNVPIGTSTVSDDILCRYNITYHQCGKNNIPDSDSSTNTQAIVELIQDAKYRYCPANGNLRPLVVGFISGGGSALLALPKPTITMDDKCHIIKELVRNGANIVELNTVRGCLSLVKNGKLGLETILPIPGSDEQYCELVTLIISDIIDDPIDKIASGPTVVASRNTNPHKEALSILQKYKISVNSKILKAIKQKEPNCDATTYLNRLQNIIIGNNFIALNAAKEMAAKTFNFKVINYGSNVAGEVEYTVKKLLESILKYKTFDNDNNHNKRICWLGGGETTITMNNSKYIGIGGRCQEMGLIFLREILQNPLKLKNNSIEKLDILFAGTDGQDGPTSAAGVQISWPMDENEISLEQLEEAIQNHNSYNFYMNFLPHCLIKTGPSGTNVMDIYCVSVQYGS